MGAPVTPVEQEYEGRRRPLILTRAPHQKMDRRSTAMWDHCPLTHRQLEVLQHCAEGLNYADIARELGITHKGIHKLLQEARQKLSLGAANRTHLVAIAMREGWIQ